MKLGFIANNDLPGIEKDAQFAAENGFEGLEFNFWHSTKWSRFDDELSDEQVKKMRAILDKHGVSIPTKQFRTHW